jgi:hypothetical protein
LLCSPNHNGTAPYIPVQGQPTISMRDGPAMQFSSRTPMAPAGANAESYPCSIHVF